MSKLGAPKVKTILFCGRENGRRSCSPPDFPQPLAEIPFEYVCMMEPASHT